MEFLPEHTIKKDLALTIDWYLNNENWWKEILSGDYKEYYKMMYNTGGEL